MSDIFELLGEDPEDGEELPVDTWVEFDDPGAPEPRPAKPWTEEDEERYNDEGCTPGGWARSPI